MNTPKFPVAKVREDGTPAVWLTFTNWMIVEKGIVREYLENRESRGRVLARRELKQPWVCDDAGFELSSAESALELYRVGWEAHSKGRSDAAQLHPTPEHLGLMGDKAQLRGYREQLEALQQKVAA